MDVLIDDNVSWLQCGHKTVSVDLRPCPSASHSVILSKRDGVQEIMVDVKSHGIDSVDAVFCVAGSWEGGAISHEGTRFHFNVLSTVADVLNVSRRMWEVNVEPSIMAAQLASHLQARLCVLTAAKAALHATPDMIGYGLAKRAVVHLTESMAADKSYPAKAICILPYAS